MRRISPTQFEVRHHNWRPTRDLDVLIVQPDRMSRAVALIAAALAGLAATPAAFANDSVAETAAGGLVLGQSRDIDMVSEDLYLSPARSPGPLRLPQPRAARRAHHVAFPMPDRDLSAEEGEEVAWPSDFRTRVAGRPVRMQVERQATLHGADHSALLPGSAFRSPPGRTATRVAGRGIAPPAALAARRGSPDSA